MQDWEPTRHGGLRRTGVAQQESAARITRRAVGRIHPPVLSITWAERLGLPECPYVIRWKIETRIGSLRLHRWIKPDDDRAFHDHPWWFMTIVLRGGYTDRSPAGDDTLRAGSARFRPALHRHTVIPGPDGAWTLLVTGPIARPWGFWLDGKFRKANKWFARYGHHPCALLAVT
jgi:hypothetical protein